MDWEADEVEAAVIAALFVATGGCYFGLEGVDPWDEKRDARLYSGPDAVVAHPPCARWCQMARLVESKGGRRVGEDDGCFASALSSLRRWGGVLEHPAGSLAWPVFNLPRPARGGWTLGMDGSWSCAVDQAAYGHVAPKATWLLYVGSTPPAALAWSKGNPTMVVGKSRRNGMGRVEMPKSQRHLTPIAFRDALLSLARNSNAHERAACSLSP